MKLVPACLRVTLGGLGFVIALCLLLAIQNINVGLIFQPTAFVGVIGLTAALSSYHGKLRTKWIWHSAAIVVLLATIKALSNLNDSAAIGGSLAVASMALMYAFCISSFVDR